MIVSRRGAARPAVQQRSSLPWVSWVQQVLGSTVVDDERAMRHDAVWACVTKIGKSVSMLPRDLGRKGSPLALSSLLSEPAPGWDWIDWSYQVVQSWLLRGNVYGQVLDYDALRYPRSIEILDPGLFSWVMVNGREQCFRDGRKVDLWPIGDIVHSPALPRPGSRHGMSPIEHHASSIGVGLSIQKFASDFFDSGAHPTHLILADSEPTDEQAASLKTKLRDATRNRAPVVLPKSIELKKLQVTPEESQFLETQRLGAAQIARIFGLDPTDIGAAHSGSSVTYANREQRSQAFVQDGLLYWIAKLENLLSRLHPGAQEVKIKPAGLMKADLAGRYASYKTAAEIASLTGQSLLTVAEMRDLEDLPPLEG